MTQARYPGDLQISVDDFRAIDWGQVLRNVGADEVRHSSLWTTLSNAARAATEENRLLHAKVLWLLADASSMMLAPKSASEPFKPFAVFQDRRSAVPEDFSSEDLTFFAQVLERIDHLLLKARIADLLWTVGRPKNFQHALVAIDSYGGMSLDSSSWARGGNDCWTRALVLSQSLKKGAGDRLQSLQQRVLDALLLTEESSYACQLARLLREMRLVKHQGLAVAQKLEALGRQCGVSRNVFASRLCYEEAALWFEWLSEKERCAELTVAYAETYVQEAMFQATAPTVSNMLSNSLYEKAIQIYREVPSKMRAAHQVDKRTEELRRLQGVAGEQALSEMGVIRSPSINITDMVEQVRNAVSGKEPVLALKELANIQPLEDADALRERVLARMREFPLQWIFECTTYSRDGRVIAKRPAINLLGSEVSDSDERVIQSTMTRDHGMFLGLAVHGAILPGLEILRQEHRLREADFVELSKHSPMVPVGRAALFGKALHAGYDGDFVTAVHLLVPQVEHMVRMHLKQAGVTTTTLDKEGIENENGLSTLMALPQAAEVFGKDIAFELQALFCDAFGPNLRNHLAHGLLEEEDCRSPSAVYAWWLGLRLVFNEWWNAVAAQQAQQAPGAESS